MNQFSYDQLAVLCTALEQFIDNQPELDTWEQEAPEVQHARDMLDMAESERHRRLSYGPDEGMDKTLGTPA